MSTPPPTPCHFMALWNKMKELWSRKQVSCACQYASNKPCEAIAYAMLTIGILLQLLYPILGQALVGIVFAVYFGEELLHAFYSYEGTILTLGVARSVILLGTIFVLFVQAPSLFFGAVFALLLRHLFLGTRSNG